MKIILLEKLPGDAAYFNLSAMRNCYRQVYRSLVTYQV
jgi:hypothetical protein